MGQIYAYTNCLVGSEESDRSVVPHLAGVVETFRRVHEKKEQDALVAAKVARARELCGGKPLVPRAVSEPLRLSVESGSESCIGKRKTNEDSLVAVDDYRSAAVSSAAQLSFYGIYDGHGGSLVASKCAERVHPMLLEHPAFPYDAELVFTDVFARADAAVTSAADKSGSTALCCALLGSTLYVGNIGDSECVLGWRAGGRDSYHAALLSHKHNPSDPDEKRRIAELGGTVVFGRLFGTLAGSRGFGDAAYKQPGKEYVSVVPHVCVRDLDRTARFLVLACDGLWDAVTYDAAVEHVGRLLDSGASPRDAAQALVKLALDRGTQDNVSVIIVSFRWSRH